MTDAGDKIAEKLYSAWRTAEHLAHDILMEVDDDMQHPRYLSATCDSHEKLQKFLSYPESNLTGVLLKLKTACYFEDYATDILDPSNLTVAPRAIIAAVQDLESILVGNDKAEMHAETQRTYHL